MHQRASRDGDGMKRRGKPSCDPAANVATKVAIHEENFHAFEAREF